MGETQGHCAISDNAKSMIEMLHQRGYMGLIILTPTGIEVREDTRGKPRRGVRQITAEDRTRFPILANEKNQWLFYIRFQSGETNMLGAETLEQAMNWLCTALMLPSK